MKRWIYLVVAAMLAMVPVTLATSPTASAEVTAAVSAAVHPNSASDGCSVWPASYDPLPSTAAYCSGGTMGKIGYFRAVQTCVYPFYSQTQDGNWKVIHSGNISTTGVCLGLWSSHARYELKGP